MNFTKLNEDIECDCLDGSVTDVHNPYLRRILTDVPTINDFKSYHEEGKTPKTDCANICGFRGVSLYICSQDTKDSVINKQRETIKNRKTISPGIIRPDYGFLFTLKDSAGKVKQTGKDSFHYDLYKTDEFTLQSLVEVEIINLGDV